MKASSFSPLLTKTKLERPGWPPPNRGMRWIFKIGAVIIAAGVMVLTWTQRSGKLPGQWGWSHALGLHGSNETSVLASRSPAAESGEASSWNYSPNSKTGNRRDVDQGQLATPSGPPGKSSSGAAARSNAIRGASHASGDIARGSAPSGLTALAAQQSKRTLGLFSKVVPVDGDTQEKLIAADRDLALTYADIRQTAAANNLSPTDVQKLFAQQYDGYRQTITDLLGPQNAQQYLALNSVERFSPIVDDFASRCAAAGDPLTPAAQIAVTLNLASNLDNPAFPRPPLILPNGMPYSQQQAFDAAAKVLTSTQLSIFKQLWSEHPYPKLGAQ